MPTAFIGIGSNIDREKNISSGVRELSGLGSNITLSSVYESTAVGFSGDNFYNLVAGIETETSAQDLNQALRTIEDQHGRQRSVPRFSSRTLDLDLLMYGNLIVHEGDMDIPRSDILTYAFVLGPLAEIAGETVHPETGQTLQDIWKSFESGKQDMWKVKFNLLEG